MCLMSCGQFQSGVLSFAPGEVITCEMKERIMDEFEKFAFAGLENDQYAILWVRHSHAGHEELNFLIPCVELSTGKSLNIAPPGKASRELFATFRSWVNAEYGLAGPDDPERSQDVSLPHHLAKLHADDTRKGKQRAQDIRKAVTAFVRCEVDAGRIADRDGVIAFLNAQGFKTSWAGKDYVTIIEPETSERVRLKGGLYNRENFDPGKSAGEIRYSVPDPARAVQLYGKIVRLAEARKVYTRSRYPYQSLPEPRQGQALSAYLQRYLAGDAILPGSRRGMRERSAQHRQRRQRMQEAAERIEHAEEGRGNRGRDISTTDAWLDPEWWDDFYGEDIEPQTGILWLIIVARNEKRTLALEFVISAAFIHYMDNCGAIVYTRGFATLPTCMQVWLTPYYTERQRNI
jgi:hypothetical protein